MNTKLLETKLKSIDHYVDVIRDLEDARKITIATLEQLLNDLKEFCPFQEGDILCFDNQRIHKFVKVNEGMIYNNEKRPYLSMTVLCCNQYGGFEASTTASYYFDRGDLWTVLKHAPAENKEQ